MKFQLNGWPMFGFGVKQWKASSYVRFLYEMFLVFLFQSSEECDCDDEPAQEDEGFMGMSPLLQAHHAMEKMEEFVCKVRD